MPDRPKTNTRGTFSRGLYIYTQSDRVVLSAISVGAAGIADTSTRCLLRKDSRAHRGRNSRLAHRAQQDSGSLPTSQDDSASSIVATPHRGDCSFSDDLISDGISATGCPQRFAHWDTAYLAPQGLTFTSQPFSCPLLSGWVLPTVFCMIREA